MTVSLALQVMLASLLNSNMTKDVYKIGAVNTQTGPYYWLSFLFYFRELCVQQTDKPLFPGRNYWKLVPRCGWQHRLMLYGQSDNCT